MPSFSSQFAIACIEAPSSRTILSSRASGQGNRELNRQTTSVVHRRWTKPPKQTVLSSALNLRADVSVDRVDSVVNPLSARRCALVHNNPRAGRTIQQPLEVKAGELIISVSPNMRCKGSHRAGIACFQFGKRLEITLRRGVFVLCIPKGFESAQSRHPTPQNKVPDRSASELFHPRRERCAGAYARAELLVGSFQPHRNVDGVAIGRVVEEAPATKIPA